MDNSCVAHRGASGLAPENTLAAMRKAMSFSFVKWIELDVQLSRDGVPVVIHDESLRRTTGRRGSVSDYEAAELNRMDAGSWYSPLYAKETIPLLDDVLALTAGKCRLNIELKTYGGRYPGMEREVVELLAARGLTREAVITSFDASALRRVRALHADVATGLIIDGAPPFLVQEMKRLGASFLSIGHGHLNAARMAELKEAGFAVMAWTVNEPARMRRLAEISPDIMICTNYPDRYEEALLRSRRAPLARWFGRGRPAEPE